MQGAPRGWWRRRSAGRARMLACASLAAGLVLAPSAGPAEAAVRPCSAGLVALTFDDGPSATITPRLVSILRGRHVPATFFMVGQRVRGAPATARLVQRAGFAVENHTWSHPLLITISDRAVHDQVAATAAELRRAGVRPGTLMRPPYGGIDDRVRRVITAMHLVPVLWTIDSRDWAGGDAATIAGRILGSLRPHQPNVVLQHDGVNNSPNSVAAVPRVIDEARRRGYCFAGLDGRGRPTPPVPVVRATAADGSEHGGQRGTRPVRIVFTLDRPTTRPVSFRVRTADVSAVAGEDYLAVNTRIRFAAGETRHALRIRVLDDDVDEQFQSIRVLLDAPVGVRIARPQFLVHIEDDDEPATVPAGPPPAPAPVLPLLALAPWLELGRT